LYGYYKKARTDRSVEENLEEQTPLNGKPAAQSVTVPA
jgi:hypothetical protein